VDLDHVAREYVVLGLRCDTLLPGVVDAYTGDPAVRRGVASEPRPRAADLSRRAGHLRDRLAALPPAGSPASPPSIPGPANAGPPAPPGHADPPDLRGADEPARRDFLDRQLAALECVTSRLAGARPGYRAELAAYFDTEVTPGEPDRYRAAHAELADLLPGGGPLPARMAAYHKAEELPDDRLDQAIRALSGSLRELTGRHIPLPAGEAVTYQVVHDRPWSAFNHALGANRSRVVVNAESGRRASQLPHLVAHEAYPGHHVERCRRALDGVPDRPERRLFLVNTPQCLLSEGLADLGLAAAVGPAWGRWAAEMLTECGVRWDGELAERVEGACAALLPARQDAALMLHADGADPEDVVAHLRRWLLIPEARARRMLNFLIHPLWRTYTTTYVEGQRLLGPWLDARPPGQPALRRLLRLMDEPLTPSAVRGELASTSGGGCG
jgi:hypothetical protein